MTSNIHEQIEYIPIYKCEIYDYNPFNNIFTENNEELSKSIADNGLIVPVIARPMKNGYQIIVGQRRFRALRSLNKQIIPAVIRELTDSEARTLILETNINQRGIDSLKHSELAEVIHEYHSKVQAQGKRTDLIHEVENLIIELENFEYFSPVGEKLNSAVESGKKFKLSARTVSRYLRVYKLNSKIKELVDAGFISIRAGVELSFLTESNQEMLNTILGGKVSKVTWKQACVLRKYQEDNMFTYKQVEFLLTYPLSKLELSVGFKPMRSIFKKYSLYTYSKEELEEIIDSALGLYFKVDKEKQNKINLNKY